MKIYIASSWKNQHAVVMLTNLLRDQGHTVLSFIENELAQYRFHKEKPICFEDASFFSSPQAESAFKYDTNAAETCDCVIYIAPSGKDAAAEVGIAWANAIPVFGLYAKGEDFGLMRKLISAWFDNHTELLSILKTEEWRTYTNIFHF